MRGFQPKNYADGGLVQGVKRIFGMDEERNARVAAYRAQMAQEKAQQQAAQAQAQAAAPDRAISDYSGMGAMKRREKAAGLDYADGGMVRGPGTGTSDDVPDDVREGTYIMPADSTQALGPDQLAAMGARGFSPGGKPLGKKVPVNLSNGEFKMPPEQVHAIGVQALDQAKNATHTPVRGFAPVARPEEPRQFFVNGGLVEDERKKQMQNQTAMYVQGAKAAAADRPPAPVTATQAPQTSAAVAEKPSQVSPSALYMQDRTQELKDQVGHGNYAQAAGTAARTAVQGLGMYGIELADKAITPMVSAARGFGHGLIGSGANAATPTSDVTPSVAPGAPPAIPAPSPADQRLDAGTQAAPATAPTADLTAAAQGAPDAKQVMSGVYRSGSSYSDSAQGAVDGAAPRGLPTAQNLAAAEALAQRSQQESMARVSAQQPAGFAPAGMAAPTVRHSGNDWQSRNDLRNAMVSAKSIMNDGGKWDKHGKGVVSPERAYAMDLAKTDAAMRSAQPGVDVSTMRENAGIQREGMQQAGATDRAARGFAVDQQRLGIDSRRADSEIAVRGFQTRQAQQQAQLRNTLIDPNATPQQKAQAQAALQALSGKGDSWKAVALQGGTDAQGNKTESILGAVNELTGEMKRMDGGAGAPQKAPYADGTELNGRDVRKYVVRNGVPVPA